jgi:hypothetical protein
MAFVDRHGNRVVGGSVEVDLRRGDYDTLLESAFFNTFDTNDHLTIGTSPQYLALEDAALDITQFRQFEGCLVNTATFNIAPNQMVQTTFDIVGRDMVQAGTSLDASPTAPTAPAAVVRPAPVVVTPAAPVTLADRVNVLFGKKPDGVAPVAPVAPTETPAALPAPAPTTPTPLPISPAPAAADPKVDPQAGEKAKDLDKKMNQLFR